MYVVVMFEPNESLSLTEQVNEVFGPFTEEEADKWTERMAKSIPERKWLIIPLSDPKVVLKLDTSSY